MSVLQRLRAGFQRLLEVIVVLLVVALAAVIVGGFVFRALGRSLVWYDEVASVGLAWLTYYGAALAALRGAHIGFPGLVNAMPPAWRLAATIFAEACVFLFFAMLAITGMEVLLILQGSTLVSLPAVSLQLTQSVIPIGAVLFMVAEALRLPEVIRAARGGGFVDHEVEEALGPTGAAAPATRSGPPTPPPAVRGAALQGETRP